MIHHQSDPWRAEIREQARVAVKVAATQREASERTLAYYLSRAIAHGLTLDEVCEASNLPPDTVRRLTDPDRAVV